MAIFNKHKWNCIQKKDEQKGICYVYVNFNPSEILSLLLLDDISFNPRFFISSVTLKSANPKFCSKIFINRFALFHISISSIVSPIMSNACSKIFWIATSSTSFLSLFSWKQIHHFHLRLLRSIEVFWGHFRVFWGCVICRDFAFLISSVTLWRRNWAAYFSCEFFLFHFWVDRLNLHESSHLLYADGLVT